MSLLSSCDVVVLCRIECSGFLLLRGTDISAATAPAGITGLGVIAGGGMLAVSAGVELESRGVAMILLSTHGVVSSGRTMFMDLRTERRRTEDSSGLS